MITFRTAHQRRLFHFSHRRSAIGTNLVRLSVFIAVRANRQKLIFIAGKAIMLYFDSATNLSFVRHGRMIFFARKTQTHLKNYSHVNFYTSSFFVILRHFSSLRFFLFCGKVSSGKTPITLLKPATARQAGTPAIPNRPTKG